MDHVRRALLLSSALRGVYVVPGAFLLPARAFAIEPATIAAIATVTATAIEMSKRGSDPTLVTLMALRAEVKALQHRMHVVEKVLVDVLNELVTLLPEVSQRVAQELDAQAGSKVEGIKQEYAEARHIVEAELGTEWFKKSDPSRERYRVRIRKLLDRLREVRSTQFFRQDSTNAVTICVCAWTELDFLRDLEESPQERRTTAAAYKERLEKTREGNRDLSLAGLITKALARREASVRELQRLKLQVPLYEQKQVESRMYCSTRSKLGQGHQQIQYGALELQEGANIEGVIHPVQMRPRKTIFTPVDSQEILLRLTWTLPAFPQANETSSLKLSESRSLLEKPDATACPEKHLEAYPEFEKKKSKEIGSLLGEARKTVETFNSRVNTLTALYFTRRAVEDTIMRLAKLVV